MPDQRLARTRATLPEGYQFGNARPHIAFDPLAFAKVLAMESLTPEEHGRAIAALNKMLAEWAPSQISIVEPDGSVRAVTLQRVL